MKIYTRFFLVFTCFFLLLLSLPKHESFAACSDPVMVELDGHTTKTIMEAYDYAYLNGLNGTKLLLAGETFQEDLYLDLDITVTLDGGYDCFFTDPPASQSIVNSMTIAGGTVLASNIVISNAAPTRSIPGTGQQTSLTDTFGEDSDYNINPLSYNLNSDGTTTDNVTGLMWQSSDDGSPYTWYEASGTWHPDANPYGLNVCGDLSLGGSTDWRLPTEKELIGIVHYDKNNPSIDQTYFPGTVRDRYWTVTSHALRFDEAWNVDFAFPYYPYGSVSAINKEYFGYWVRCVRGIQREPNFNDNGNGTVTDTTSGLTWQQSIDATVRNWEEALTYCENLELPAGQTDWRLPNIKELQSLVDTTTYGPAIDTTLLPTNLGDYWSSTHGWTYSHHDGKYIPSGAWSIYFSTDFSDGYVNKSPVSIDTFARCVRGGN